MEIALREYQTHAINSIFHYFKNNNTGNPVLALPTGTGKSIIIAKFLDLVFKNYKNQKIMILTHVKELIQQNYDKLLNVWPQAPVGIYSAGLKQRNVHSKIIFGGIASVVKHPKKFGKVDLIIIDEVHLVSPSQTTQYQKFIKAIKEINPALRIVGLTATPWRLGQGYITEKSSLFTDICFNLTSMKPFNKLIKDGFLCPLIPKKTHTELNVENVRIQGGEFVQRELQEAVDKYEVTKAALEETIQYATDRKAWLVFATGIEHCIHVTEILNELGINARYIHSGNKQYKMPAKERDENITAFKQGKITALVNANVLTTGFDHPNIDLIVMLRPTASTVLWVQSLGRGTRPVYAKEYDLTTAENRLKAIEASDKQNCLILDFAGNTNRLGPINDPVIPKAKDKNKKGEAPIKLCDNCQTYNHASTRYCISCGYEFEFKVKIENTASTREIIKTNEPIVKDYSIDHITYDRHQKTGSPNSLKVTYYCKFQCFNEFICIEYSGKVKKKAISWWKKRTDEPYPQTVKDALNKIHNLKQPKRIKVWINKKYPEILNHYFN